MAARNWPTLPPAEAQHKEEALMRHGAGLPEELPEPECHCHQTDVDLFDSRDCELHDERSAWNTALREVTQIQRYAAFSDMDCPF